MVERMKARKMLVFTMGMVTIETVGVEIQGALCMRRDLLFVLACATGVLFPEYIPSREAHQS